MSNDKDNLKTPDAYVKNHGVEVEIEKSDPEFGQINVRIKHNDYQSTRLQLSLEQAKELFENLETTIREAEDAAETGYLVLGEVVQVYAPGDSYHLRTGTVEEIYRGIIMVHFGGGTYWSYGRDQLLKVTT